MLFYRFVLQVSFSLLRHFVFPILDQYCFQILRSADRDQIIWSCRLSCSIEIDHIEVDPELFCSGHECAEHLTGMELGKFPISSKTAACRNVERILFSDDAHASLHISCQHFS